METPDKIGAFSSPLPKVDQIDRVKQQSGEIQEAPKTSRFKDLLEDIERLRIQGKKIGTDYQPVSTDGAQDLDQAMDLADRTHENAMDMRRSLENAFRRHMKG